MLHDIETIKKYFLEKTKKEKIEDLVIEECKGVHIVPISGKNYDVEITDSGGIKIIGETKD